jgi:hypothetical protein
VLAGLCSGAYWSLHAALRDERVAAAVMLNTRALFWHHRLDAGRDARNVGKALRLRTWRKLLSGRITRERALLIARGALRTLAGLPERLAARLRARRGGDELARALDTLEGRQQTLVAVFTASEPLLDELQRDGRLKRMSDRPNVWTEVVPGPLSSHTLEPLPLQRAVHALVDAALARELQRGEGAHPGGRMREALR